MKYTDRERWTLDVEVVSDHALSAAQIEFCATELCKAIGADGWTNNDSDEYECHYEADGKCGGVRYETDAHRFHRVDVWATSDADLNAIVQIVCAMCINGCTAECWDGHAKADYLMNFGYHLAKVC